MVVGAHLHHTSSLKAIEQAVSSDKRPAELQQLRPVCIGDARETTVTKEIMDGAMLALVWAATGSDVAGSITPSPLTASSLEKALVESSTPPRVVVVWMKHGAKGVAQKLEQAMSAAQRAALTIIWIKHDPHTKNGSRHVQDTIVPALKMIIDGKSCAFVSKCIEEKLRKDGATAGCIGAEPQPIQFNPTGEEAVVKADVECEHNLEGKELRTLVDKLLSCDAAKVAELRDRLLSNENDGSHCLYVHRDGVTEKADIERCRAITLSACEALSTSGEFYKVLRVRESAELSKQCETLLEDEEDKCHRVFLWLDMKPAEAKSVDTELMQRVCNEHEGGASFVLTLQAADAAFDVPELFEPFDIKAAQDPKLAASSLHSEIKLIIQNAAGERYMPTAEWLAIFNGLLRITFEALCKYAPIAGLYAVDEVRVTPRRALMLSHSLSGRRCEATFS